MGQEEPLFSVVSFRAEKIADQIRKVTTGNIRCLLPPDVSVVEFHAQELVIIDYPTIKADGLPHLASIPKNIPCLKILNESDSVLIHELKIAIQESIAWPLKSSVLLEKLQKLTRLGEARRRLERLLSVKVNLVGDSAAFRDVLSKVEKFSRCDAPVLLLGETGTGKEQIARAIHYLSDGAEKPFIAVNCGAIPDSLVENELFGHRKGAYTDAKNAQPGLVEQAENGTLFLDEIEGLSQKGQIVLLRFLQEFEYRPLGSSRIHKANVRVVAASNESLESRIAQGDFRMDLYYRLNILSIGIPPLRDRKGDVTVLAQHFLQKFQNIYQQETKYFSQDTIDWMRRYGWPGNVRELENMIMREFLLADDDCISFGPQEDCFSERRESTIDRRYQYLLERDFQEAKSVIVGEFEKCYLEYVLRKSKGNISSAARRAGKERRTFTKLLDKHGLADGRYRSCD